MNQLIKFKRNTVLFLSAIAFLLLMVPVQSIAQNDDMYSIENDIDADITDRLDIKDSEYGMTTKEGSVDMMLTNHSIIIQFSDQFLADLDDEIRSEADVDEASVLAEVITSMVSSGVHSLLNRALEIPIQEIKKVYYDDGKLHIIDRDGEEIFEELEINDVYIMEDFSRRDARKFVSEAERRMI